MNVKECRAVLSKVGLLFNRTFDELTAAAWAEEFNDLSPKQFDLALRAAARASNSGFFPTVGEVARVIKESRNSAYPLSPESAFEMGLSCFKWLKANRGKSRKACGEAFGLDRYPILRAVLNIKSVADGLSRLCQDYNPHGTPLTKDQADQIRRDFIFAYRSQAQVAEHQMKLELCDTPRRNLTGSEKNVLKLLGDAHGS